MCESHLDARVQLLCYFQHLPSLLARGALCRRQLPLEPPLCCISCSMHSVQLLRCLFRRRARLQEPDMRLGCFFVTPF